MKTLNIKNQLLSGLLLSALSLNTAVAWDHDEGNDDDRGYGYQSTDDAIP